MGTEYPEFGDNEFRDKITERAIKHTSISVEIPESKTPGLRSLQYIPFPANWSKGYRSDDDYVLDTVRVSDLSRYRRPVPRLRPEFMMGFFEVTGIDGPKGVVSTVRTNYGVIPIEITQLVPPPKKRAYK